MCGIAGILSKRSDWDQDPKWIRDMTFAQRHRGPDAEGFYRDEWISLGHRRLSIIDISDAANQPFTDNSGRYVAVFNGEIYNFRELRDQLTFYDFSTSSDTEVLVAAFAHWGPSCLKRIKGMFAFAIWDCIDRSLFLCRDRSGIKPLYYWQNEKYFCFASEIRSILTTGLVERCLDRDALNDYFRFQSFCYPRTPVQGICQLEAGCYVTIRGGHLNKERYWYPGVTFPDIDFTNSIEVRTGIRRTFESSIAMRLISDVPIGAFLSGGIDSSLVVACMARAMSTPPKTFNISFSEKEYDESSFAKIIAEKYRTEHQRINLKPEIILDELTNALDAMDTPSADGINTYVVSKAIHSAGIKVALSGIGGDELFAGYPFFTQIPEIRKYASLFRATRNIRKSILSPLVLSKSRLSRFAEVAALPDTELASIYPLFRQIMNRGQLKRLLVTSNGNLSGLESEITNKKELIRALPFLSQITVAEYLGYTQNTLLKDTDQMSMAVALEVREPFFDHELIDLVLHVPDYLKFPQTPKKLLVDSFEGYLPPSIVDRKKQGFLFPWKLWLKTDLSSFCQARLDRIVQRDFIQGHELLSMWNRFRKGDPSVNWSSIWAFVVLEHWLEQNNIV